MDSFKELVERELARMRARGEGAKLFETPANNCPYCGEGFDHTIGLTGPTGPTANDFTICVYCTSILGFNDDLTVRKLSLSELIELAANEELCAVISGIREFNRKVQLN